MLRVFCLKHPKKHLKNHLKSVAKKDILWYKKVEKANKI